MEKFDNMIYLKFNYIINRCCWCITKEIILSVCDYCSREVCIDHLYHVDKNNTEFRTEFGNYRILCPFCVEDLEAKMISVTPLNELPLYINYKWLTSRALEIYNNRLGIKDPTVSLGPRIRYFV